jgi:murein DD-endopeptidase MepM/ murein hydrolase activator NlpD
MGGSILRSFSGPRSARIFVALVLVASCCNLWSADSKPLPTWSVQWQPVQLVNGSPVFFQVKPGKALKTLSGKWLDHEISFAFNPKSKRWNALAGVSFRVKPGVYTLVLTGTTDHGDVTFERRVRVRAGKYRITKITVPSKYTAPSPEQLETIARDKQIKQDTFSKESPQREWAGSFVPPLAAPFSDTFGTQRTFNGEVKSVHEGLDFAATAGSPVAALNSGTVLLARPLYFEGNCVVLDHGQGLMTLYLHLSEFKVKEGDTVKRGQELGLVGGTGRATGPHLHIAVRWQGVYIDPATLLKMKLP